MRDPPVCHRPSRRVKSRWDDHCSVASPGRVFHPRPPPALLPIRPSESTPAGDTDYRVLVHPNEGTRADLGDFGASLGPAEAIHEQEGAHFRSPPRRTTQDHKGETVAKKALVVAVTATGMLVIGAPAFAAAAPADNPLFQQPLVSNVNVLSQNVVPTGNTNGGNGNNAGQGNVGGNGNNIGDGNNGGNGSSNGGAGNTVGGGNAGGVHSGLAKLAQAASVPFSDFPGAGAAVPSTNLGQAGGPGNTNVGGGNNSGTENTGGNGNNIGSANNGGNGNSNGGGGNTVGSGNSGS